MRRYFKIEYITAFMILLMLSVSYLIKVQNESAKSNYSNKELEVYDSVVIEANATHEISRIYSDYAVKVGKELRLINITYRGETAKVLKSKYGRSIDNMIYLDDNISLLQSNGYYYKADQAMYDKKNNFLYVKSPFIAYLFGGNIVHGSNLEYNMNEEIVTAQDVDAVFYTAD